MSDLPPLPYGYSTQIPWRTTKTEIEIMLDNFGANSVAVTVQRIIHTMDQQIVIVFQKDDRWLKMVFSLPTISDYYVTHTENGGKTRDIATALERLIRARWRYVAQTIKMKIESIRNGDDDFHNTFLPYHLMPDGRTLGETTREPLEQMYRTGQAPQLSALGIRLLPPGGKHNE